MRHGSLFSGIGGFDLAAEWMGWENVFHCEWNEFGQKVLKHYWPQAISYNDITKTDFTIHRGSIDIITGGFPCQPYSTAGKRLGKDDERHLWPHMLRAIREIEPTWVVGENVRGLISWNGGMVFDEVQADLEAAGYEVIPFLLPACGVNAPHKRERIWFIAYSESKRRGKLRNESSEERPQSSDELFRSECSIQSNERLATNAINKRLERQPIFREFRKEEQKPANKQPSRFFCSKWENFPTQPPLRGGNDGLPERLGIKSISYPKWRNESIKAYGNAVAPQLVLQIFKAIQEFENLTN